MAKTDPCEPMPSVTDLFLQLRRAIDRLQCALRQSRSDRDAMVALADRIAVIVRVEDPESAHLGEHVMALEGHTFCEVSREKVLWAAARWLAAEPRAGTGGAEVRRDDL